MVFPTPQPISNILRAGANKISSLQLVVALNGLFLSLATSSGASSGNSVNNQCLSLKNLESNQ